MSNEVLITFLGTASAQPSNTRNMSCLCVRFDSDTWMFDCGEASQHQIRKSEVKLSKLQNVFITHNHGDHLFGLPGLLCTLSGSITEEGRIINIFGPKGIRMYLRAALGVSFSFLNFSLCIHELIQEGDLPSCGHDNALPFELEGKDLYPEAGGLWNLPITDSRIKSVVAGPLSHTVASVGFVIQENSIPGSLDASVVRPLLMKNKVALAEKGIKNPMALMGQIKAGKTVELPDGTKIAPNDVVGPPKKGRKLVILGDTSNSDSLLGAALDCDVVIHEATNAKVGDEEKSIEEVEKSAIEHGHSTPQMAGNFAKNVNARLLLLNHFSSRYKGDQEPESQHIMKQIESLAKNSFENENVAAAFDLFSIVIPRST